MASLGLRGCAHACAAHAIDASAGLVRTRVVEIRSGEFAGGFPAIDAREEEGSGGFKYSERRAKQLMRYAEDPEGAVQEHEADIERDRGRRDAQNGQKGQALALNAQNGQKTHYSAESTQNGFENCALEIG